MFISTDYGRHRCWDQIVNKIIFRPQVSQIMIYGVHLILSTPIVISRRFRNVSVYHYNLVTTRQLGSTAHLAAKLMPAPVKHTKAAKDIKLQTKLKPTTVPGQKRTSKQSSPPQKN